MEIVYKKMAILVGMVILKTKFSKGIFFYNKW